MGTCIMVIEWQNWIYIMGMKQCASHRADIQCQAIMIIYVGNCSDDRMLSGDLGVSQYWGRLIVIIPFVWISLRIPTHQPKSAVNHWLT